MKNIKIFSDFACPFCYIGFSIADKLRKENPDITFEWFPYELDSSLPLEGSDLAAYISQDQIDTSYRRIKRLGSEYGLVYNNKIKKFNTTRLHKAALYANTVGKYYEFAEEAFRSIFEEGRNIGDPLVINEIGLVAGLNIATMNQYIDEGSFDLEMEEAKSLIPIYEIDSVPSFIIDDKKTVTLLKDYEKFKKDLIGE